ncbi:MAG: MgtC/SapB family protein [Gammaproteobacteria bacterium]|nr:MAG: MgtC/SapB family protein [Gammaproteobacteria bacterium]
METIYPNVLTHLFSALLAGGLIGLERTYNGRPAGFRTHTLVCISSALLMLLTVYQIQLLPNIPIETMRIDPTRMGQGIMTGIGFLGAGVIMKEGLTVRGLTTAASIWITASIGILIGVGFYFAATVATLLTLGTLSLFRWVETWMPTLHYGRLTVRSLRKDVLSQDELCDIIHSHDFTVANPSYNLGEEGKYFEHRMSIRTRDKNNYQKLAESLTTLERVLEFSVTPAGD